MKTTLLKLNFIAATLLICLSGCVKPPCKCDTAQGTIEQCVNNPSIWFINVSGPSKSCIALPVRLFLPNNLPVAYQVDGLTVSFDYNLLADSVALNCNGNETYAPIFARRINICNIKKDENVLILKKPNIYLYPTKETKVKVNLDFKGRLVSAYPDYDQRSKGWTVVAQKDGTLKNLADQHEYQYLFWEGSPDQACDFDMNESFCVKGSDTKDFLQKMLPKLGLVPREYNEMIVYWLPQMANNPYNLIHFAAEEYTKTAVLNISPKPDNIIRVFMAYQASTEKVKTREPFIKTPKREGFTVVEWGGCEVPTNLGSGTLKF